MTDLTRVPHFLGLLRERGDDIAAWFDAEFAKTPPPFYTSVDVRHSGTRIVPVDTNLYPAGWNNISDLARGRGTEAVRDLLDGRNFDDAKVLLLIEDHTRNTGYHMNVMMLTRMIRAAGADIRIGRIPDNRPDTAEGDVRIDVEGMGELHMETVVRDGTQVRLMDGWVPDMVVLNNDLSAGVPAWLEEIDQPVCPPAYMGWHRRKKSEHFAAYDEVVDAFCDAFDIDPWLMNASWKMCGKLSFRERSGMDCVARNVDELVGSVRPKHREYGLDYEPYVFVKADAGTYGMGVMTASSGEEIYSLNKKGRHSMNAGKGGQTTQEVLIQEGVPTADLVDGGSAEPVVYLLNGAPVGGFYRVHAKKGEFDSLNSVGSSFSGLCEEIDPSRDDVVAKSDDAPCPFPAYSLVARLAALAAGREMATFADGTASKDT